MALRIRKGDLVRVIAGNDKGKTGRVLQIISGGERALIEGLHLVKKHTRKTQDNPQGGIFDKEAPIHISNLKKEKS